MQKQGFLELRSVMSFDGEAVNESLFYRTNEVVINWLFFALMLTATEIGFRLGRKLETRHSRKH